MVHDGPRSGKSLISNRFSLPSGFLSAPSDPSATDKPQNDSNLLALFARMQPLRASLDFLPMRLSMFEARAAGIFPTACKELQDKRSRLEQGWKTLEKEAEDLRRELGEDRWILVFRNAGRQAEKMCESVERSICKLQEAIDAGTQHVNRPALAKRVESFEAKRTHYGPAIDRVLAIIQKGVEDRLTVNGEVLRLHADMTGRVQAMHHSMKLMQSTLEESNANQNAQLRDSISSIVSMDQSMSGSLNDTLVETPGSSPASSVVVSAGKVEFSPRPGPRGHRSTSSSHPGIVHRHNPPNGQNQRPATPLSSHSTSTLPARTVSPSPGPVSVYRQGAYKPPTGTLSRPAPTPLASRPRWSSVGKVPEPKTSHGFRSASGTTPSPSARRHQTSRSGSSFSSWTAPSPLGQEATRSPSVSNPSSVRRGSQQLQSFAERAGRSATGGSVLDPLPYHRGRNLTAPTHSSSHLGTIRSPSSAAVHGKSKPTITRPPSSSAHHNSSFQSLAPPLRGSASTRVMNLDRGYDAGEEGIDEDMDPDLEHQLDDESAPTPPARPKPASRPGSVAAKRRLSMLPIPTSKITASPTSGRESSLGNRPAWR